MGSVGKSVKEESSLYTTDFKSWRKSLGQKYGVRPDWDEDDGSSMENLTQEQRKAIEEELDRFFKVFPEFNDRKKYGYTTMHLVNEDELPKGWGGSYSNGFGQIYLTPKLFDEELYKTGLEEAWYAGVLTTFHPKGTTSISTLSHELGHTMIDAIIRSSDLPDFDLYTDLLPTIDKVVGDVTKKAAKKLNDIPENLAGKISGYAQWNDRETVSEAISDYVANGKKANRYSQEIVKEVKKKLRSGLDGKHWKDS